MGKTNTYKSNLYPFSKRKLIFFFLSVFALFSSVFSTLNNYENPDKVSSIVAEDVKSPFKEYFYTVSTDKIFLQAEAYKGGATGISPLFSQCHSNANVAEHRYLVLLI